VLEIADKKGGFSIIPSFCAEQSEGTF